MEPRVSADRQLATVTPSVPRSADQSVHHFDERSGARVTRQAENATNVANMIGAHAKTRRVIFPGRPDHPQAAIIANQMTGPGNVVAFDLGSREAAWRFLDALAIVDISNNLGDAKSLITHPASTTHRNIGPEARAAMGIGDGMLRLSVGLEDVEDLIADLTQALAK